MPVVDVLLHGEVPAHREDLDAGAGDERGADERHEVRVDAEDDHRHRRRSAIASMPQNSGRLSGHAQQHDRHGEEAECLRGEDVAPALAADRVLGDDRAEDEERAVVDHVQEAEAEHDHPQPRGRR